MTNFDSEQTPNIVDGPEFLTVEELAQRLRVGRTTAYTLCRLRGFPAIKVGGSIRIPTKQLNEWLESGKLATSGIV